jgi:hypothetical protein
MTDARHPDPFNWQHESVWTCLRCLGKVWTKASVPRCPYCGFVEDT